MPIRPEHRHHYKGQWHSTAREVKERAGWRCEDCYQKQGEKDFRSGAVIQLGAAHINRVPGDDRLENLRCLCRRCHIVYDAPAIAPVAARTRRLRQRQAMATPDLFGAD